MTPAIPAQPGQTKKGDVEYERKDVRDIMMICEPKIGRREVLVTEHRTKQDFAHCMNHIFDMYPDATKVRVVMDNLNTHTKAALYEAFPAEKARQIARKLEFHYLCPVGTHPNMVAG